MKKSSDVVFVLIMARAVFVFFLFGLILYLFGAWGNDGEEQMVQEERVATGSRRVAAYGPGTSMEQGNPVVLTMPAPPNEEGAGQEVTVSGDYVADESLLVLDEDEVSNATEAVRRFFSALSQRDEDAMLSLISSKLNFMGNTNATKVDVLQYMKKLYSTDIIEIQYHIDELKVKKVRPVNDEYGYDVALNVDAKYTREDLSKETYANFDCKVMLKSNYKISSFSMRKVSSY